MTAPRVVLLGRSGCHLCDEARAVVSEVCSTLDVSWTETDVDSDSDLRERYGGLVPVVLVDGHDVAHYRVDPRGLRRALG